MMHERGNREAGAPVEHFDRPPSFQPLMQARKEQRVVSFDLLSVGGVGEGEWKDSEID